jgi:hypothetical protein
MSTSCINWTDEHMLVALVKRLMYLRLNVPPDLAVAGAPGNSRVVFWSDRKSVV